ncbi:hypothetical protein CLAFUW4_05095 [Fulvia fulva]|uniref:Uncharacterized protein n=1 Tax=Passalora fulva TaxID=5499 RepID=A0A9Q8UUH6_PASFU|nr:uncharacterized protein CLAFUR5_11812 [Fulvia fulva]KAK4626451.1 hypothetical protein CLAFUR4_05081 [Fulvia fulva]KAK4628197.1 hypothetical protein CLAFUR0_05085 [Fulvia fulva]UJO22959.1 hypothetical protein CLAFUR5_11812 [Fulvia fulva]WPV14377.1 hypothetical protein CLAFUW4_05095 [Fulvia fulva]WPV28857.1 hypothetical protein CLAFUW7_05089 [Fulvia fulva]
MQTTRCLQDTTHIHEITYQEEITAVLNRLSESFDGIDGNPFLYVNATCGFHVHVGNHKDGFVLQTVKHVACTWLVCERQLDSVHASHRIGGSALNSNPFDARKTDLMADKLELAVKEPRPYNSAASVYFVAAAYRHRQRQQADYADPDHGEDGILFDKRRYPLDPTCSHPTVRQAVAETNVAAWAKSIIGAPSLEAVLALGFGTHATNLNLANLAKGQRQTIEFRQHAGTVDPQAVLAYIDLVAVLVLHANNTSATYYDSLIAAPNGKYLHPSFAATDLMAELGSSTAWKYYGSKTRESHLDQYDAIVEAPRQRLEALGSPFAEFAGFLVCKAWMAYDPAWVNTMITRKLVSGGFAQGVAPPVGSASSVTAPCWCKPHRNAPSMPSQAAMLPVGT